MQRDYFKKLYSTILSNGVRQDEFGEWTIINSSTNKRRMQKTGSSVGGKAGENSKEWIPAKILITPDELKAIYEKQNGKCFWFGVDLDLDLLYKDHPDWYPKHPLCPSVDKIDPNGDYEASNIVICTRFANFGRNVYPFDKFSEIVAKLKSAV